MAHFFDRHNASLREGGVLAVVVRGILETPHWMRDITDFPPPLRKSEARLRLACPPPARRGGVAQERGVGGGSDPRIFGAGAPPGRGKWPTLKFTISPVFGVAPSTVIPGGKAIERFFTLMVDACVSV